MEIKFTTRTKEVIVEAYTMEFGAELRVNDNSKLVSSFTNVQLYKIPLKKDISMEFYLEK